MYFFNNLYSTDTTQSLDFIEKEHKNRQTGKNLQIKKNIK
jgi:hypothetical protein